MIVIMIIYFLLILYLLMLIIKSINFIHTSYILKQVTPNVLHFWLERLRGVDMRLFDFITVMLFTER